MKDMKKLKKKRYLENKKKKWYATRMNTYIYIQSNIFMILNYIQICQMI